MEPQVTFRGLFPCEAIIDRVWRNAHDLSGYAPLLKRCHVIIERLKASPGSLDVYRVSVRVSGPEVGSKARVVTSENLRHALRQAFRHIVTRVAHAQEQTLAATDRVSDWN